MIVHEIPSYKLSNSLLYEITGISAKALYTSAMGFLLICLFILPSTLLAVVPDNFLTFDPLYLEKLLLKTPINSLYRQGEVVDHFTPLAKKHGYWKNSAFPVPKFFRDSTKFWHNAYTAYSSYQVVLHHRDRLGTIYKVLDFEKLHKKIKDPFLAFSLQNDICSQEALLYKKQLSTTSPQDALSLRFQTGQKEKFHFGLENFAPYARTIESIVQDFNLPKELIALPFVESNFNTHAVSSAGAQGVWQFISSTARSFMTLNQDVDYRLNPVLSTYAAMALLSQNYKILKRWDLALTAYNAGTPLLYRASQDLKKKKRADSLENIFASYPHPNLGFAVQNYYAAFLALSHLIPNRHLYFKDLKKLERTKLTLYRAKIDIVPEILAKDLPSDPLFLITNRHLLKPQDSYRQPLIVTSTKLHPKRYQVISKSKNVILKNLKN